MSEDEVKILVTVEDARLKRRLKSWWNPGSKHRRTEEGIILQKLCPWAYIFAGTKEGLRLTAWLQLSEGADAVKLYLLGETKARGKLQDIWLKAKEAEKRGV